MIKKGFTLAEVLITMAILGVIAAVTLPALNVNVNERAAATKYQKALSSLSNIGAMVAANDGFNYSDIVGGAISDDTRGNNESGNLRRQVWAVMDKYAKLDRRMTQMANNNIGGDCHGNFVIYFKDGSAFCFPEGVASREGCLDGIQGVIDINGMAGPNTISGCTEDDCSNEGGKMINDQFEITLIGEDAYPGHVYVNASTNAVTVDPNAIIWTHAAMWAANR